MPLGLPCEVCGRCGRLHPGVPFLTAGQAASYLGISLKALWSRRARGEMPPALLLGRSLRFGACDIAAMLREEE